MTAPAHDAAAIAEIAPVVAADRELAEEIMLRVRGYAVRLPRDGHWLIQLVARHRAHISQAKGE